MRDRLNQWLKPLPAGLRRAIVGVIGWIILMAGILMLVLPGPGIVVTLIGLAILATEFAWAEAMLIRARHHADRIKKRVRFSRR